MFFQQPQVDAVSVLEAPLMELPGLLCLGRTGDYAVFTPENGGLWVEGEQFLYKNRVMFLPVQKVRVASHIYDGVGAAAEFYVQGAGHRREGEDRSGRKGLSVIHVLLHIASILISVFTRISIPHGLPCVCDMLPGA